MPGDTTSRVAPRVVVATHGAEVDASSILSEGSVSPQVDWALGPVVHVPTARQRRAAQRLRARKVGRVVRRIDPFTVLRVAALFYVCLFLALLAASLALWSIAVGAGAVESVEGFIRQAFALEAFAFDGERIFTFVVFGGTALVAVATGLTAMLAVLFNLICDLTGGIRFTVVEEERAVPMLRRR